MPELRGKLESVSGKRPLHHSVNTGILLSVVERDDLKFHRRKGAQSPVKWLASAFQGLLAAILLCTGLYFGWTHDEKKEPAEKVPYIFGVLLSTFPPLGFGLYYYYWELNPAFSSACAKQAWLGCIYFVVVRAIAAAFPLDPW